MFKDYLAPCIKGTLVEGNFSRQEFDKLAEETNERITTQVNGFFNNIPAKYNLHVFPVNRFNLMILDETFIGSVREYLKGFPKRTIKTYEQYKPCTKSAFLFPYHKLAFVFNDYRFKDLDEQCNLQAKLEQLGYKIIFKRKKTSRGRDLFSEVWEKENINEFLRMIRNPEHEVDAADKRAKQIIDLVHKNIKSEFYTFAEFIPKHWVGKGPYNDDELIVSPIKMLLKVPGPWGTSKLEELCRGLPLTRAIGLTSRVQTKDGLRHIPMIDFESMEGVSRPDERIDPALNKVGIKGMVITSGKSYHFYGFKLLTTSQWSNFMKVLNKSIPYVDENWPELQLKQGYSMLRLTPSKRKFTQPCYLRHFCPKNTGTDKNSASISEQVSVAAVA